MSRCLPLLAVFLSGCLSLGTGEVSVIRSVEVRCPEAAPPLMECQGWERRPDAAFEFNVDLQADRLEGQRVYGRCLELLRAYHAAWTGCPGVE